MKLKQPNQVPSGGFCFYFRRESDNLQIKITGRNLRDLADKARKAMVNSAMSPPDNLAEIVEHQICLRQPEPTEACWNSGAGDALHHDLLKPFLKKAAKSLKALGLKRIGEAVRRKAGCSSCGGTREYRSGVDNLGRAGKLNKVLRSRK